MVIKIKLKNADKHVLLDHEVFEALSTLPFFKEHHVLDNLREHSSGVPVFQKFISVTDGKMKVESIYLALFIAKKYVPKEDPEKRMFLKFLNGDKLDLRLKNLKWEDMSLISRKRKSKNQKEFKGVKKTAHDKFIAIIADGEKSIHLGPFDNAEEAAIVYNGKAIELFGEAADLNPVDEAGKPIPTLDPEQTREHKKRLRKPRTKKSESGMLHGSKDSVTQVLHIDNVNLVPASFERLKKRGRKTKVHVESRTISENGSVQRETPSKEVFMEQGNDNP